MSFGTVASNIWSHSGKIGRGMGKGAKYGAIGGGALGGINAIGSGEDPFSGIASGAFRGALGGATVGGGYIGVKGKVWASHAPLRLTGPTSKAVASGGKSVKRKLLALPAPSESVLGETKMINALGRTMKKRGIEGNPWELAAQLRSQSPSAIATTPKRSLFKKKTPKVMKTIAPARRQNMTRTR